MSWVFIALDDVYKLKKPVRLPYLDFSSLDLRLAACKAEVRLNRRLAPDIYRAVVPLVRTPGGLSIGGAGEIVDWLVWMRRLDEAASLQQVLTNRTLQPRQLDPLVRRLLWFYQHASRVGMDADQLLRDWHLKLRENRQVLLDPRLGLPTFPVFRLDRRQRRFLDQHGALIRRCARSRSIVDGHGDLRPEHVWPGPPVNVIDCLEFSARLRAVDPLDDIAFLVLECERLGGIEQAKYLKRRLLAGLHSSRSEALFAFYGCYRATLRARLALAHLLEPACRNSEKWRTLARSYLELARARSDAMATEPRP